MPPRHALDADCEHGRHHRRQPSGTAATARATPRMRTSKRAEKPLTSSTRMIVTIMTAAIATTTIPSICRRGRVPSARAWLVGRSAAIRQCAPFRSASRWRHHGAAAPVGHGRAAENHVVAVAEAPSPEIAATSLVTGRLAGQRRFRRLQRHGMNQPRVGRNGVASSIRMMSPGTTSVASDAPPLTVAQDVSLRRGHRPQCGHRGSARDSWT